MSKIDSRQVFEFFALQIDAADSQGSQDYADWLRGLCQQLAGYLQRPYPSTRSRKRARRG